NVRAHNQFQTLTLHDALPICEARQYEAVEYVAETPPLRPGRIEGLLDQPAEVAVQVVEDGEEDLLLAAFEVVVEGAFAELGALGDRKSTRLNSSHVKISYAVF